MLKTVQENYRIRKLLSDGRIVTVCNTCFIKGRSSFCSLIQNCDACLIYLIHDDKKGHLNFYILNTHGSLAFSFSVFIKQPLINYKHTQNATMHQSGTILILHTDGTLTSISSPIPSPFWIDFLQRIGLLHRSSSCDEKIVKTVKSGIVDIEVKVSTSERDVIVVDTESNVKLLDKDTGDVKRILLSETNGLKCPISVTLDDFGMLWVGTTDGKIFFCPIQGTVIVSTFMNLNFSIAFFFCTFESSYNKISLFYI